MSITSSGGLLYWNGNICNAFPFSLFIWIKPTATTLANSYYLVGSGKYGGVVDVEIITSGGAVGDKITQETKASADSTGYLDSTSSMVEGQWQPVLSVWESATVRRLYFSDGAVVTSAVSYDPNFSIHDAFMVSGRAISNALPYTGDFAEVAAWSSALGQTDFNTLAAGATPSTVQAGSLIEYWPLATHAASYTGVNGRVLAPNTGIGSLSQGSTHPIALPDTTAPTLTSPTGSASGSTTATGTVTTSEANGTLYRLASINATETAATVKAAALTQAVSGTSLTASFTGLTASTTYYAHYVHRDAAGNDSARVSSSSFTTSAAAATATTLNGPGGGAVSAASGAFTVGANGTITGTLTITPSDNGVGGTFAATIGGGTSVTISAATPTATFTYTPSSAGAKTISISGGGLTAPSSLTYTATLTSGTVTVMDIANGSGSLLASTTLPNVVIVNRATRALVLALADQTTSAGADLAITNGALVAGTAYMVFAYSADGTAAGAWPATAT